MHRTMIGLIFTAAAAIGLAYATAFLPGGAPRWAAALIAIGTVTILVATIALSALRRGRTGSGITLAALCITWVILTSCFLMALLWTDGDPAAPVLWLGLPRRAALVLYGIGLLPAFVLPVAYALTFERDTLTAADWERIRTAAQQMRTPTET